MKKARYQELIAQAQLLAKPKKLSKECSVGHVGSILITDKGTVFSGVSIVSDCGLGFCAEHSAIAAMITAGESVIKTIVAVRSTGRILPPCGRCRELILQINDKNYNATIILDASKSTTLKKLLPLPWQRRWQEKAR